MNIKTKIIAIIMITFIKSFCFAGGKGTASGSFLKLGVDAKAMAMGGSYTAIANGASAIYWNPAGLDYWLDDEINMKNEVNIMYAKWIDDINYQYIMFSHPVSFGSIGLGVQRLSMGSILETDETGQDIGNYTPCDTVGMLSFGRDFEIISLGFTAKYIDAKIKNNAVTYTFDAGMRKSLFEDQFYIGLTGQNLIGGLKYHEEEDDLVRIYRLGLGFFIGDEVLTTWDIEKASDNDLVYSTGMEYTFQKRYSVRAGYTTRNVDLGAAGYSVGFGANRYDFSIDYAYVPLGLLDEQGHYISLGYKF